MSTEDAAAPVTELPTVHDGAIGIFVGDQGQTSIETRRVLVQLLLGPSVDSRRQTKLWSTLLRDEALIRSRLHELFLDLIIDQDHQVAFTRQITAEGIDAPILLRRATLTFLESALLLFLRYRLIQGDAHGERAAVSMAEMSDHLNVYKRDGSVDHAKFDRQVHNAIDKAKKLSLLQRIRGTDDRYEVSPTLKLLFPAEEILALTRTYESIASVTPAEVADDQPREGGHEADEDQP